MATCVLTDYARRAGGIDNGPRQLDFSSDKGQSQGETAREGPRKDMPKASAKNDFSNTGIPHHLQGLTSETEQASFSGSDT